MPKRQKKVSFSGLEPTIWQTFQQFEDSSLAIEWYFSQDNPHAKTLFAIWTTQELQQKRQQVLIENEMALSLVLLSALEASFRIDFNIRIAKKYKDGLSREFRALYYAKGNRVALEDEVITTWREHETVNAQLVSDIKSAFKYRHWLAHGRYWQPKLGQDYDFLGLQMLCQKVAENFSFYTDE